ncbi:MAG: hypothetical protein L0J77_13780 [Marinobacter sp.]|nr:hypothetical protein [Marinobacter sp.]
MPSKGVLMQDFKLFQRGTNTLDLLANHGCPHTKAGGGTGGHHLQQVVMIDNKLSLLLTELVNFLIYLLSNLSQV